MIVAAIFLALIVMICFNVPIAVALAISAILGLLYIEGTGSLVTVALDMYDGSTKFSLIAIPMFVLAGAIMNAGGISKRLIAFVSALLGFIRGALAMINIAVSLFFAEISGSAVADVAALGSVMIPAMRRKGYPRAFAAAVTSSSATLAVIIPPSIPMILYGVMSDSSIVQLFVAGVIPGILGGLGMMVVSYWMARRHGWPVEDVFQLARLRTTFIEALPALVLPVIILGGIFGGIVTATEGAGVAVVAALIVGGLIYRELNWRFLYEAAIEGGVQTAVVMLLVAASALIGVYLTELQVPQKLAAAILNWTDNRYVVLALLNVFFLAIGLFLHSAAAIILVVPVVMPLVNAVGIDPVHFGLIVTLNLGIGQQTPPVASVLITACAVAKANVWEVSKVNVNFVAVLFAILVLVTYVPAIPMSLVEFFYR